MKNFLPSLFQSLLRETLPLLLLVVDKCMREWGVGAWERVEKGRWVWRDLYLAIWRTVWIRSECPRLGDSLTNSLTLRWVPQFSTPKCPKESCVSFIYLNSTISLFRLNPGIVKTPRGKGLSGPSTREDGRGVSFKLKQGIILFRDFH